MVKRHYLMPNGSENESVVKYFFVEYETRIYIKRKWRWSNSINLMHIILKKKKKKEKGKNPTNLILFF